MCSTSSWSSSLSPLGLVKSSGPSHSGWEWPWDKLVPTYWEDEDEEDDGSGDCMPSLLVFFMLRSKVPFSSTSMSDSYRVQKGKNWSKQNIGEYQSAVQLSCWAKFNIVPKKASVPWCRALWVYCWESLVSPSSEWTGWGWPLLPCGLPLHLGCSHNYWRRRRS